MSQEKDSVDPKPPTTGTPPDHARLVPAFLELVNVTAKLRGPDGCPWDREQTLKSVKPCTLEETYELLEAIDSGDDPAIIEELGDVLLQVVLDAQIGADEGRFDLICVIEGITAKLIRRHPHVFADVEAHTVSQVKQHWDRLKRAEKQRSSVMSGIPLALPALARALQLSSRAARVGFDWPRREMLFDKLREEVAELSAELFPDGKVPQVTAAVEGEMWPDEPIDDPQRCARIESEIGDILFVVANMARRWGVNPEEALRLSNRKFAQRFGYIERKLAEQGRDIQAASLEEMEALYQQVKSEEE